MENILHFLFQKKIIAPILIFIFTIFLTKISKSIISTFFTKGKDSYEKKRRTTIIELTNRIFKFFLYALAIMMVLDIYGVDTKGILASLGIAGVVLGFAYIILENYYVIGDIIRINDFQGEVIEVSLKTTKVQSASGETYIFTNRNVSSVINLSQNRAGVKIMIPTAYEEETSKVETALKMVVKEAKKLPNVDSDSKYLGIDSFVDSAINYAIIIYCKSSDQWEIKRTVLKMIKEMYEKENIKIPYNQIEVHNDKQKL